MPSSWLTLIPPVMVLASAFAFRTIHFALILGIISAVLVACQGNLLAATSLAWHICADTLTNIETLCLYGFLVCLGILVSLFNFTGSARAFAYRLTHRIRSVVGLELTSITLSLTMFVDDYLSILAIGHMMSPIADFCKVSRLKLAYLIHAFAGPIVILFPISSWAATIVMYLSQANINTIASPQTTILANPFAIYLSSLPYMLYSFLIVTSTLWIVKNNISYGSMRTHEHDRPQEILPLIKPVNGSIQGILVPLAVLMIATIIGLAATRNHPVFSQHPFIIMFLTAMLAIGSGFFIAVRQETMNFFLAKKIMQNGIAIMVAPIGIVFLATVLSQLLANEVETGCYLGSLAQADLPLFLLPAILFMVSLVTTFATASAWGTFAILLPITVPMIVALDCVSIPATPEAFPLLLPALGAVFSGAVCGDQISPITDTSTMIAASTRVSALTHCYTQFPYTIPAIIGCVLGFLVAGYCALFMPSYTIPLSMLVGFISCFLTLYCCRYLGERLVYGGVKDIS